MWRCSANQAGRLVDFSKRLHERVSAVEDGLVRLEEFVQNDSGGVLFDRVVDQARTSSGERRRRLANLLAATVNEDEVRFSHVEKLLHTLNQLADADVLRLYYHSQKFALNSPLLGRFCDRYPDIGDPPSREMQVSQPDRDRRAIFDSYDNSLIRLGLLTNARTGNQIIEFGELLLRYILDDGDDSWKKE